MTVPSAQFQGQLAREQRLKVFIATSALLRGGWSEWAKMSEDIIRPNLNVMFELKNNFVANRITCLLDLVTVNGYSLKGLSTQIGEALKSNPNTEALK
jgi:hypothetical protein